MDAWQAYRGSHIREDLEARQGILGHSETSNATAQLLRRSAATVAKGGPRRRQHLVRKDESAAHPTACRATCASLQPTPHSGRRGTSDRRARSAHTDGRCRLSRMCSDCSKARRNVDACQMLMQFGQFGKYKRSENLRSIRFLGRFRAVSICCSLNFFQTCKLLRT